jgi:hypothetical protein
MIRIISQREGFRRCGVAHTVEPVEYPDDRWSAEELRRLQDEPMLTVEVISPPPPPAPPPLPPPAVTDRDLIPKRTYTRRTS